MARQLPYSRSNTVEIMENMLQEIPIWLAALLKSDSEVVYSGLAHKPLEWHTDGASACYTADEYVRVSPFERSLKRGETLRVRWDTKRSRYRVSVERAHDDAPPHASSEAPVLSKRELQMALAVFEEKQDKEIAWELGLTIGTVKTYLRNLRAKLNLKSRVGIALWVSRNLPRQAVTQN